MNFPDLPHLRKLQSDLWQWPESKASLFVGAGFSLNADPLPGINSKFPTWRTLVKAMFDELHPYERDASERSELARQKRFDSTSALRIASEYEAAFGRQKLNALIHSQTPDLDHIPSQLHKNLMSLPWADVFTTNYDTLLERVELAGRSYQCVTTPYQLTTAFSPKIVKLHGSFPSNSPFIITEDDFRTYPRDFAPFVNTIQQALIQTSVVLLGFSGDDPNFLAWTGWIRDHLGEQHAPIYLVGALGLGNPDRALLARRGVTAIDFSVLVESSVDCKDAHKQAVQMFVDSLTAAKPQRPDSWPEIEIQSSHPSNLPTFLVPPRPIPDEANFPTSEMCIAALRRVMKRWRFERESYPGWIVASHNRREEVFEKTNRWLPIILHFIKDWPAEDQIPLYVEINWRLEVSMISLFPDTIVPFSNVVDAVYPSLISHSQRDATTALEVFEETSRRAIFEGWVTIAMALLREARETLNEERWEELNTKISQIVNSEPEFQDRHQYELALWMMWKINLPGAKLALSKWTPSTQNPLAGIRKAALLAELDQLGEARSLLRERLRHIRRSLNYQPRNIELLSSEGWCTYLLYAVEHIMFFSEANRIRLEFSARWRELRSWECDPWQVQDYFETVLSGPPPEEFESETVSHSFDPGKRIINNRWRNDDVVPYMPAFACLRLYEQAGIPMRMRLVAISGTTLISASKWVEPFLGMGTTPILIRAGERKSIVDNPTFNRAGVATMEVGNLFRINTWCSSVLKRELETLNGPPDHSSYSEKILGILPELLSRLAVRLSGETLNDSFNLAMNFHFNSGIRRHLSLHEASQPWFERLFCTATPSQLMEWLVCILDHSPFDGAIHLALGKSHVWPDPLESFPPCDLTQAQIALPEVAQRISTHIEKLLAGMALESGESFKRSEKRLLAIDNARLMTVTQRENFCVVLWSKTGEHGLPERPDFTLKIFLSYPPPGKSDVIQRIKRHVLEKPIQFAVSRNNPDGKLSYRTHLREFTIINAGAVTKPQFQLLGENSGSIEWSHSEAKLLTQKALSWWNSDKTLLKAEQKEGCIIKSFVGGHISSFLKIISLITLPNMKGATEARWNEILQIMQELRDHGECPTPALPYILIHRSSELGMVTNAILEDLQSETPKEIQAAARAVRYWAHLGQVGKTCPVAKNLISALVERVMFRRKTGILACIGVLRFLLIEQPAIFDKSLVLNLASSLAAWHAVLKFSDRPSKTTEFLEVEKPDLRALIAQLADAVGYFFKTLHPQSEEHPAVAQWRQTCANDTLPETRSAFSELDALKRFVFTQNEEIPLPKAARRKRVKSL